MEGKTYLNVEDWTETVKYSENKHDQNQVAAHYGTGPRAAPTCT